MGPEAKFYKYFKSKTPEIIYTRIENASSLGTPDALCYNANHFYFTIEFKVCKGNKVNLSSHQLAYHVRHPKNSFILVKSPDACGLKLYEGSSVLQLDACGLALAACSQGLEACRLKLLQLGA
jgi:hypothetical protein|tara:strand:- start:108 stop:476 length:369 start_codon:yes stop_codon:yes gene_type:complete